MTAINKLISAFVVALEIEEKEANDSLTYNEDKRWDSTAHMILVAQLENNFELMFEIDEIIDMSSFVKAKALLENHGVKF